MIRPIIRRLSTESISSVLWPNGSLHKGGLEAMAVRNARKSKIVYDVIDAYPDFYVGRAQKDSRSLMNATFNLPTSELEALFVESAAQNGMVGLKGHRVFRRNPGFYV